VPFSPNFPQLHIGEPSSGFTSGPRSASDTLFFKNLVVWKPKERKALVRDIHEEIGHFNKGRTLIEVKKIFF
jgi:hypothetical protein